MLAVPEEERRNVAVRASMAAAAKKDARTPGYVACYGRAWAKVRVRLSKARSRCEDVDDKGYPHYGGRGIKFVFLSVADAAIWVLTNLGPPPPGMSIDRVDNNRHYEPGNLRWATSSEQNSNKRAYKRSEVGNRVRALARLRPDLTEQTLRTWVNKGLTDDEITNRRKHLSCGL